MSFVFATQPQLVIRSMHPTLWKSLLILIAVCGLASCANHQSARLLHDADMTDAQRYYVAEFEPDERGIEDLIRDELARLGYEATSGPEAMMPPDTDVLVTYWDKWMWDITMYMVELDITFRDPDTREPFAVGNSMHASLTRRSPEEMVQEVLQNIFNQISPPEA